MQYNYYLQHIYAHIDDIKSHKELALFFLYQKQLDKYVADKCGHEVSRIFGGHNSASDIPQFQSPGVCLDDISCVLVTSVFSDNTTIDIYFKSSPTQQITICTTGDGMFKVDFRKILKYLPNKLYFLWFVYRMERQSHLRTIKYP